MRKRQGNQRVCGQPRFGCAAIVIAIAIASIPGVASGGPVSGSWRVLKTIAVKGDGNWDYIVADSNARRLYVAHGNEVNVLNADNGQPIGLIANTPGVHGIALVPDMHRAFISEGLADHVAIVDTDTLRTLRQVPVGKKPDAIIYDSATQRVFVNNGDGNSTTAIDAATGNVVGTLDLGGSPEFAAADGQGHVYVNLEEQNETVEVDSKSLRVEQRWPLSPCQAPTSMAIDRRSRRLFIGCRNHLMAVLNFDTGKIITTMPIGVHVDAAIYDPARHLVFFSNADGTLNVFRQLSADQYVRVQTVETALGARTMALDPVTHRLFLPTADLDMTAAIKPGEKPPVKPGTFRLIVVGN